MSLHKYSDIEPFQPIKYETITFEAVVPLGNRPKLYVKILGPLPAPPHLWDSTNVVNSVMYFL